MDDIALSMDDKSTHRKSMKRVQKYRDEWEKVPDLGTWLCKTNDVYKAKCKYCNSTMKADVSVLKAHAKGQKHINNLLDPVTSHAKSITPQCLDFQTENLNLDEILKDNDYDSNDIDLFSTKRHSASASKSLVKNKGEKCSDGKIDLDDQLLRLIAQKLTPPDTNLHAAFGEYVAEQLRTLRPNMAALCKKMINEVIFEADIGHLNKYSRVINDLPTYLQHNASQTEHLGYAIILETPNKSINTLDRILH